MTQRRVTFSSDGVESEESPFSLLHADLWVTEQTTKPIKSQCTEKCYWVRHYSMNVYSSVTQIVFWFPANSYSFLIC